MTVEAIGQVTTLSPVVNVDVDGNLSIEQVEGIIRAWRGQAVGQAVPMSPVGEWDIDGSLSFGKSNLGEVYASCASYTYFDTRQEGTACYATLYVACRSDYCTIP